MRNSSWTSVRSSSGKRGRSQLSLSRSSPRRSPQKPSPWTRPNSKQVTASSTSSWTWKSRRSSLRSRRSWYSQSPVKPSRTRSYREVVDRASRVRATSAPDLRIRSSLPPEFPFATSRSQTPTSSLVAATSTTSPSTPKLYRPWTRPETQAKIRALEPSQTSTRRKRSTLTVSIPTHLRLCPIS